MKVGQGDFFQWDRSQEIFGGGFTVRMEIPGVNLLERGILNGMIFP